MIRNTTGSFLHALMVVCLLASDLLAAEKTVNLKVSSLFKDNMVLQQKTKAPVWGWALPGDTVSVKGSWQDNAMTAVADKSGKWLARVSTPIAGGPHTLTITGSHVITIRNVMIGEVWLCGGQSNMAMTFYREKQKKGRTIVYKINNHEAEAKNADYPTIRIFRTQNTRPLEVDEPAPTINGQWQVCAPSMARSMPAVPYFFGRELHQKLSVPIGLIVNAISSTRIEKWLSPEGIAAVPELKGKMNTTEVSGTSGLYNSSVYPLVPYAIRGAIWYQGESNDGDHMIYTHKMRALINGWRSAWKQGDFPFYYVQLAPCKAFYKNDGLPKLWEAQSAALAIANTGMASNTDISDLDLHPSNKQDVGKRLSLWALAKTYGQTKIIYDGPRYASMQRNGNKIVIRLTTPGSPLKSRDGKRLDYFTIAGENRKFVPATAIIDGDTVVVSSKHIPKPVAVRFGWQRDARPNLMNAAGLPAYPFRTDTWPLDKQN